MRIKNIELHNFGSYGGHNSFNFESDIPEERVVVIGGKNGTGKTTLFTAIQVCLYGNFAFGFKTAGKRYLNEIYNLINNQVRIDENESAFIEIGFQQVDNTDLFNYIIRRSWSWPQNDIQESLSVWQNGRQLEEDELLNFQNYLIHLIPPDMLKLYFFDGEKIADYFLGNKEVNIRDALMVLSGNDTFDILYDQVKRVLKISENAQSDVAHEYLTAQAEIEEYQQQVQDLQQDIESIQDSIEKLTAEIECHKKEYSDHGGITVEEWTDLHNQLKAEEEKRERLNWQRKAFATDSLPFVMLPELVNMVLPQMQAEKEHQTYQALKKSLEKEDFAVVLENAVRAIGSNHTEQDSRHLLKSISDYLLDKKWEKFEPLFGLSSDEEGQSFSVHILRNEKINTSDLSSLLRTGSVSVATNVLGETAITTLQERYKVTNVAELRKALFDETAAQILLPVEISKDRLSSGEKQIFVMSLYWAMMNQSKNELPFNLIEVSSVINEDVLHK